VDCKLAKGSVQTKFDAIQASNACRWHDTHTLFQPIKTFKKNVDIKLSAHDAFLKQPSSDALRAKIRVWQYERYFHLHIFTNKTAMLCMLVGCLTFSGKYYMHIQDQLLTRSTIYLIKYAEMRKEWDNRGNY